MNTLGLGIASTIGGVVALATLHFGSYKTTDINVFHSDEIEHIYPFRLNAEIELNNGVTMTSMDYMHLNEWARDWDYLCEYKTEENIFGFTRNTEMMEKRTQIVQNN